MKKYCFITVFCIAIACLAWPATAEIITMGLDDDFSGTPPESAVLPWLTAQFDDHGSSGSVTITLSNSNLIGIEFVSEWSLNLDPALDPTQLIFSSPVETGTFTVPTISKGVNAFKADGDGYYDVLFSFDTANQAGKRFGIGEAFQITVSGIPTLTAGSFVFGSNSDKFPYYSAAHVQGIQQGTTSCWIAATTIVPEPATLVLAVFGITGMMLVYRRQSKI